MVWVELLCTKYRLIQFNLNIDPVIDNGGMETYKL